jgi:hypothetical protein
MTTERQRNLRATIEAEAPASLVHEAQPGRARLEVSAAAAAVGRAAGDPLQEQRAHGPPPRRRPVRPAGLAARAVPVAAAAEGARVVRRRAEARELGRRGGGSVGGGGGRGCRSHGSVCCLECGSGDTGGARCGFRPLSRRPGRLALYATRQDTAVCGRLCLGFFFLKKCLGFG